MAWWQWFTRNTNPPSTDFTLDIYNLGTPANAFGIYAAESSPDYHFLPIGAEGYGTNEILNFLQDEFYVKLSGLQRQGENRAGCWSALPRRYREGSVRPHPCLSFFLFFPRKTW